MDTDTPQHETATTCAYCGVGCGVLASSHADGSVTVKGDPAHPANFGRLCAKGAALGETFEQHGRLLYPQIDGARASWDDALSLVADSFTKAVHEHGPDSVAFYVSGQLLIEDYYVANKLMKGFIGSGNIDTNSRLCMASSVAGHKRAFGEDIVPGVYEDLEIADLVVLVGSNLAWCHPVLHQRLIDARRNNGTKIVVIDPRKTATTADCDLHLALDPASDVALFNGLLSYLFERGACDDDYVARHTSEFPLALAAAAPYVPAEVARRCGLDEHDVLAFYAMFMRHRRTVTVYSQGVNQSSAGTDKVNAIINCHLATGRIGRPGSGPFSVTGQPNAMGGREVGGLANTLAAHIDFDDEIGVSDIAAFWQAPQLVQQSGLKAVDLFDAVAVGKIKALWIMATNPAVSMPNADHVRVAIDACPFVVVSDVVERTDTNAAAEVLLPAAGWGEKDGTVTNSERRISRQRAFRAPPGEARADWHIISEVAVRMGYARAFNFTDSASVFREYAAMTTLESGRPRKFDIGALAHITRQEYDSMLPVQWPLAGSGADHPQVRLYGNGEFSTTNGRARFVATKWRAPAAQTNNAVPLKLTSGRVRDQWHTMTRSGLSPRLSHHIAEPYVEVHPATARKLDISDADIVDIIKGSDKVLVRALLTDRIAPDTLFVPMHWSDQNASKARVNTLFAPNVDPISGQPELKFSAVDARRFDARWYGFAVTRARPDDPTVAYWARMRTQAGWRMELAASRDSAPTNAAEFAHLFARLCGPTPTTATLSQFSDEAKNHYRFAAFNGGRLLGALYVSPHPVSASRVWVSSLLQKPLTASEQRAVLAGTAGAVAGDVGALICTCNAVGANTIARAVVSGSHSVQMVGEATSAGTGCGSCRMEVQTIIDQTAVRNGA